MNIVNNTFANKSATAILTAFAPERYRALRVGQPIKFWIQNMTPIMLNLTTTLDLFENSLFM